MQEFANTQHWHRDAEENLLHNEGAEVSLHDFKKNNRKELQEPEVQDEAL